MQKIVKNIKKPLLLSPAGSQYKALIAFAFGADAVYCGSDQFGLRASDGFKTIEQIDDTIALTHRLNKKIYIAVNSSIHQADRKAFKSHLLSLIKMQPDALILSDPAVIQMIHSINNENVLSENTDIDNTTFKTCSNNDNNEIESDYAKIDCKISKKHANSYNNPFIESITEHGNQEKKIPELHLSTQANVTNSLSAAFWHKQGIRQIVFARELSLEEIFSIKNDLEQQKIQLHIETFIHGAMCISYSGRCLLSLYMTNPDLSTPNGTVNRDANRGECVHPCRWQYKVAYLTEKERQNERFTLEEDNQHSYILSSKDLCMIQHIPLLMLAGIDSFKIEGRMKSSLYTAATTFAYRQAIDFAYDLLNKKLTKHKHHVSEDLILNYIQKPESFFKDFQDWPDFVGSLTHYLELFSHRPYTTGFYFPSKTPTSLQTTSISPSISNSIVSSNSSTTSSSSTSSSLASTNSSTASSFTSSSDSTNLSTTISSSSSLRASNLSSASSLITSSNLFPTSSPSTASLSFPSPSDSALSSSHNKYQGNYQLVGESIDANTFMCKNKFIPHEQKLILFSSDGVQELENYKITDGNGNIPLFLKHSTEYKIHCDILNGILKKYTNNGTKNSANNKIFFYFLLSKK